MRLGQDVLSDLAAALPREWLLGNGLGGSSSGTCVGANTRTTHAHLVASGPHGRLTTLLLRCEERLLTPEGTFALGGDRFARPARSGGHRLLHEFRLDPWPVWTFHAGGVELEKSLFMIYGHNAIAITYRQLSGPTARITVSPLIAARDPAGLQHETAEMRGAVQGTPGRVQVETLEGRPALMLWHNGAFLPARAWQRVHYPPPGGEGDEVEEDAFVPGYLEFSFTNGPGTPLHLIASAELDLMRALAHEDRLGSPPPRTLAGCVELLERDERQRIAAWETQALSNAGRTVRQAAAARSGSEEEEESREAPLFDPGEPWIAPLAESLRLGLVRRGRRLTLVSSLPVAEERGADVLRALPGLLALRGFDTVREIIRGYVEYLDEGRAPESFDPDDGTPRYGDPSVALWLVVAAERYVRRSHDVELAKRTLHPALEGAMHFYRSGTHDGIRVDGDGLLAAGTGSEARRRADLNALWHHAMVAMAQLARTVGRRESGAFYLAWANDHQRRFNETLWDEERGCLFESLGPEGPEPGLAPSQLWAVSLSPPILGAERAARLIATIERELLTPIGLREAPGSAVVSPLWLGPFCTAYARLEGRSAAAQARVRALFYALRSVLEDNAPRLLPVALETVPATEAAGERLSPRGDPQSVTAAAELIRVWVEELDHVPATAGS